MSVAVAGRQSKICEAFSFMMPILCFHVIISELIFKLIISQAKKKLKMEALTFHYSEIHIIIKS